MSHLDSNIHTDYGWLDKMETIVLANYWQPFKIIVADPVSLMFRCELGDQSGPTNALALSLDGSKLACSQVKTGIVSVWDVPEERKVATLTHDLWILSDSISFHPDGQKLLCACNDSTFYIWDICTTTIVLSISHSPLGGIAITPKFNFDGSYIVSTATLISLCDVPDVRAAHTIPRSIDSFHVHNSSTGDVLVVLNMLFNSRVQSFALSPVADRAAVWSHKKRSSLYVMNIATGVTEVVIDAVKKVDARVYPVCFNSVGDMIITSDAQGEISICCALTGTLTKSFVVNFRSTYLYFSSCGDGIIIAGEGGTVHLVNTHTSEVLQSATLCSTTVRVCYADAGSVGNILL